MTFGELRSEILGWLDEAGAITTDQSYLNATAALKQAQTARLTTDRWRFMLYPSTQTITTVAAKQDYSLHPEFGRPYWTRNTTRRVWMTETPARNFETDGIDPANDIDTYRFELGGYSPVFNQPTSASVVTISSSSPSDTGAAKAVKVAGEITSGGLTSIAYENITPNGSTPIAGTVSFTRILELTKPTSWVGSLTATSNGAAVTLVTLASYETARQYRQLSLLYLPTAGETITYRFYRKPKPFGQTDNDFSDIPEPFDRILIYDALLLLASYDNRLDGGRVGLWTSLRDQLDLDMREYFSEGQSLSAEPRLIGDRSSIFGSVRFPD